MKYWAETIPLYQNLKIYFFSGAADIVFVSICRYPNCPNNCPTSLAKTRKKKIQKIQKIQKKVFFAFFGGLHKFVENRQINRKDFKIYKKSIIFYEI